MWFFFLGKKNHITSCMAHPIFMVVFFLNTKHRFALCALIKTCQYCVVSCILEAFETNQAMKKLFLVWHATQNNVYHTSQHTVNDIYHFLNSDMHHFILLCYNWWIRSKLQNMRQMFTWFADLLPSVSSVLGRSLYQEGVWPLEDVWQSWTYLYWPKKKKKKLKLIFIEL